MFVCIYISNITQVSDNFLKCNSYFIDLFLFLQSTIDFSLRENTFNKKVGNTKKLL